MRFLFYKIFLVVYFASVSIYLYSLYLHGAPIDKHVLFRDTSMYLAIGYLIFHIYRVESGSSQFMLKSHIFVKMFTIRPVLLWCKGGSILFLCAFTLRDIIDVLG